METSDADIKKNAERAEQQPVSGAATRGWICVALSRTVAGTPGRAAQQKENHRQNRQQGSDAQERRLGGMGFLARDRRPARPAAALRILAGMATPFFRIRPAPTKGPIKVPKELSAWASTRRLEDVSGVPRQRDQRIGRHLQDGDARRHHEQRAQEIVR